MRALKIVAGLLIVLVAAVAALVTAGLPAGLVATLIQPRIEQATGWRIAVNGPARLGLSPLRLTLHDIVAEAPGEAAASRLTLPRIAADLDAGSLLSGQLRVTELTLERPELRLPLQRQRRPAQPASDAAAGPIDVPPPVRVVVRDGAVILTDAADGFESRLSGIALTASLAPDRQVRIAGAIEAGGRPLTFEAGATLPDDGPAAGRTIPVTLSLDAPQLLREKLTATAEVRPGARVLRFNAVSGRLGAAPFTGWASVELAGKPLVKLDLDFQRLDLAVPSGDGEGLWSERPFDLRDLRYFDAALNISAAEFAAGAVRLAPVAIRAGLEAGMATATLANAGLYEGHGSGEITIDAGASPPALTLNADLDGVRARPLLSGLAGFDALDAAMQAKIALRGSGASPRAMMASLAGTAFLDFRNGEIRNVNVAQMIRSLTSHTLSGWQEDRAAATDLSQLSASFEIGDGRAATSDLALAGPLVRMSGAGEIDLAARTLAFKVEPRLVMTLEGQGGAADPLGLGVPVRVEGPWAEPRIYPDVAGILDNPDGAYAQLRALGQGLFGQNLFGNGKDGDGALGGRLGEALGGLLQSLGSSTSRSTAPQAPPAPDDRSPARPGDDAEAADNPAMDAIMNRIFGR